VRSSNTKGMQSRSISHAMVPCASLQITSGPTSCRTSSGSMQSAFSHSRWASKGKITTPQHSLLHIS